MAVLPAGFREQPAPPPILSLTKGRGRGAEKHPKASILGQDPTL